MRARPPLALEIAAARGVAALSRRLGAGGGTTIPGKLLAELDRGAIDRLAARLPTGTAVVSATNGKTTTTAMAAEILRPRFRLAHNHSGANLVSGVASTLLASGHHIRDNPSAHHPDIAETVDSGVHHNNQRVWLISVALRGQISSPRFF